MCISDRALRDGTHHIGLLLPRDPRLRLCLPHSLARMHPKLSERPTVETRLLNVHYETSRGALTAFKRAQRTKDTAGRRTAQPHARRAPRPPRSSTQPRRQRVPCRVTNSRSSTVCLAARAPVCWGLCWPRMRRQRRSSPGDSVVCADLTTAAAGLHTTHARGPIYTTAIGLRIAHGISPQSMPGWRQTQTRSVLWTVFLRV